MSLPKISIVIPSYNYGKYIEKAIKSVIDQNYPNYELLVLDGGSQDETVDIIKKYESKIAFWRSHKDSGSYVSANEGIEKATGDIIGILCADDWYELGTFNDVGQAFANDRELDIVSFYARYHSEDKTLADRIETKKMELDFYGDSALNARFYRKKIFQYYGKISQEDRNGEYFISADWEYMLRLCILPLKNKLIEKVGYTYFMHENSMSFGKNADKYYKKILEEQLNVALRFLDKKNIFSKQVVKTLNNILKKTTIRLYLLAKETGDSKMAEHYKKIGKSKGSLAWQYSMFSIIRRNRYTSTINKINPS